MIFSAATSAPTSEWVWAFFTLWCSYGRNLYSALLVFRFTVGFRLDVVRLMIRLSDIAPRHSLACFIFFFCHKKMFFFNLYMHFDSWYNQRYARACICCASCYLVILSAYWPTLMFNVFFLILFLLIRYKMCEIYEFWIFFPNLPIDKFRPANWLYFWIVCWWSCNCMW